MNMVRSRRKKETYRDRWLKEHPRVSFYLDRDKYEMIKSMAESKNMSIKEFILSLIDGFEKYHEDVEKRVYERVFKQGYLFALIDFTEDPKAFYERFKKIYPDEEPLFYTYPCSVCRQPVIANHKSSSAETVREVIRKTLTEEGWGHACCHEVKKGRRTSCPHLPKGLK